MRMKRWIAFLCAAAMIFLAACSPAATEPTPSAQIPEDAVVGEGAPPQTVDLGSEADVRNVTGEYLLMILNQRMEDGKPVFVTTNFELDGLNARYGEKIMSRLFNSKQTHLIRMDGEDLRRKRR